MDEFSSFKNSLAVINAFNSLTDSSIRLFLSKKPFGNNEETLKLNIVKQEDFAQVLGKDLSFCGFKQNDITTKEHNNWICVNSTRDIELAMKVLRELTLMKII